MRPVRWLSSCQGSCGPVRRNPNERSLCRAVSLHHREVQLVEPDGARDQAGRDVLRRLRQRATQELPGDAVAKHRRGEHRDGIVLRVPERKTAQVGGTAPFAAEPFQPPATDYGRRLLPCVSLLRLSCECAAREHKPPDLLGRQISRDCNVRDQLLVPAREPQETRSLPASLLFSLRSCPLIPVSTLIHPKTGPCGWCPAPPTPLVCCWLATAPPLLDLLVEGDPRSLDPVVGSEGSGVTAPAASPPSAGGGVANLL
jgi:hypothetical protein